MASDDAGDVSRDGAALGTMSDAEKLAWLAERAEAVAARRGLAGGPCCLQPVEVEHVRTLLVYRDEIVVEFEFRRSRAVLRRAFSTWFAKYRGLAVSLAGVLAFVIALRRDLVEVMSWLLN